MNEEYNQSDSSDIHHDWSGPRTICPKNLLEDLDDEHFNVFLRVKPSTSQQCPYSILDDKTLLAIPPEGSVSHKLHGRSRNSGKKFTFSSILSQSATQKATFDKCVLPCLKSCLHGYDALVMAYGTTSAGKTYTMQGNGTSPGMIPRSLSYLFTCLDGHLIREEVFKPACGSMLQQVTIPESLDDRLFKNKILNLDLAKYQKATDTTCMSFSNLCNHDDTEFDTAYESLEFKEIESHIEKLFDTMPLDTEDTFSVWISMVEIYNENVFDLLQLPDKNKSRPCLLVGENEQGEFFVKNMRQVQVASSHEAYQVSQFGKCNLSRASTNLNYKSSRSHCIVTVSLIRHQVNGSLRIHRLSFADLAGSERIKKTTNNVLRVAESKSINKSLSVLGLCLKALKENQDSRQQQLVPVRDSKLTKLFKNALLGLEKFKFIINISADAYLFDETMQVLKFSALAQEIVIDNRPPRFSSLFYDSLATSRSDLSQRSDCSGCSSLRRQLEDVLEKKMDLENLLELANNRIVALGEHLSRQEDHSKKLSSEMEGCLLHLSQTAEQYRKEIKELNESEVLLRRSNLKLKGKNQELKEKVLHYKEKLQILHDKALEDYDCLMVEKNETELEKNLLLEKLESLENQLEIEKSSREEVEKEKNHNSNSNKELQDQLQSVLSEKENLNKQVEELTAELNEKNKSLESLLNDNIELKNKLKSKEEELEKCDIAQEALNVKQKESLNELQYLREELQKRDIAEAALKEENSCIKLQQKESLHDLQYLREELQKVKISENLKEADKVVIVAVESNPEFDDKLKERLEGSNRRTRTAKKKDPREDDDVKILPPSIAAARSPKPLISFDDSISSDFLVPKSPEFEDKSKLRKDESNRKARTTKKKDPRDHPALKKSARRAVSQSPPPVAIPRSAKKQLFSSEDFLDLSGSSDFVEPEHQQRPKRSVRRKNTMNQF